MTYFSIDSSRKNIYKQNINNFDTKNNIIKCYIPNDANTGITSLTKKLGENKKIMSNCNSLIYIKKGTILDKIIFKGINNFYIKGNISIGVGLLNNNINDYIIQNTDSNIVNMGGERSFSYNNTDGSIDNIINESGYLNIELGSENIEGNIEIVLYYHNI